MEPELRVATAVIGEDTEPDWYAGHQWIDTVPADFLRRCHEGQYGAHIATDTEIAERSHRLVEDLKAMLAQPPRTVDWCHVRGARVYITGWLSMTGSEEPPAAYLLLSSLAYFTDWDLRAGRYGRYGSLLGALGFDD